MFIAYSCYDFKSLMGTIHRKHPELNIVYLGNVDNSTVKTVLEANNIDIYLYAGPTKEPYLTYDLWNTFKGKIINMTTFFHGDEDTFDAEGFYNTLSIAIILLT